MNTKKMKKWYKMDFHVHTPASSDYKDKNVSPKDFLKKCMEKGLDAIAITDHNCVDWISELQKTYKELSSQQIDWFKELVIFPGVELTVSEAITRYHLLVIFSPKANSSEINQFLGKCNLNKSDEVNANFYANETVNKIFEYANQNKCVVIPAHIDSEKGLLHDCSSYTPEIKNTLVTFYCYESINSEKDLKIEKKEIKGELLIKTRIQGSDSHNLDTIGDNFSWIKLSSNSIEALKFALEDGKYKVKNCIDDPNISPKLYIDSIEISDLQYCGRQQALKLDFDYQSNTIIGGRGSGKSTILESIRTAAKTDRKNLSQNYKRFLKEFPEGVMTSDSKISITFIRNEVPYICTWNKKNDSCQLKTVINSQSKDAYIDDLEKRFPIRIFSQKEINKLADNTQTLLEYLDEYNPEYKDWKEEWNDCQNQYKVVTQNYINILDEIKNENIIKAHLSDTNERIKIFEINGCKEDLLRYSHYRYLFKLYPHYDLINLSIKKWLDDLKKGISENNSEFYKNLNKDDQEVKNIMDEYQSKIDSQLKDIISRSDSLEKLIIEREEKVKKTTWYSDWIDLGKKLREQSKEFQAKNMELSFEFYENLLRDREKIEEELKHIDEKKEEQNKLSIEQNKLRNKFVELRNSLFEKRKKFINDTLINNPFIQVDIISYGDFDNNEIVFRNLFNFTDTFVSSILDEDKENGLLSSCYKNINNNHYEKIEELKDAVKDIIKNETNDDELKNKYVIDKKFITKLRENAKSDLKKYYEFLAWLPEDKLELKVIKQDKKHKIDITQGSIGEKSAGILAFLLNYGKEPLILDQPEDDLDNFLITDLIVSQLRENKEKRQVILVTHNPNIVVNGDAEKIFVMKFINGQIHVDCQGSLDSKDIRKKICDIMEGGEEAFKKRFNKIISN